MLKKGVSILLYGIVLCVSIIGCSGTEMEEPTVEQVDVEEITVETSPKEHNYATWLDFPHDEMELADEELYSYLVESYSEIDWYGAFDKGDMEKYETYKNVFKELVLQERTFVDMESGEEMLLGDHNAILLPDDMDATYDMENYDYCIFDMNGDGTQELTILANGTRLFFKYLEDEDQIVLCEERNSGFYQLGGTGILLFSDGTTNYFYQWNEDGEIECIVHFFTRTYDGEHV